MLKNLLKKRSCRKNELEELREENRELKEIRDAFIQRNTELATDKAELEIRVLDLQAVIETLTTSGKILYSRLESVKIQHKALQQRHNNILKVLKEEG